VIDLARAAFACIGTQVEFEPAPFSGLLPAVVSGQNDVIWSTIYYTPERALATTMLLYMRGLSSVVVPKANPEHVHTLMDLCGLRVGSQPGSLEMVKLTAANADCVKAGRVEIKIVPARDRASELISLDAGRLDADTGPGYKQLWDSKKYAIVVTLADDLEVGCAVNKKEKELSKALYDAISALRANGTEAKIYTKYEVDPSLIIPVRVADQ
jgi:polar amino acid transport system substrate-binding protein